MGEMNGFYCLAPFLFTHWTDPVLDAQAGPRLRVPLIRCPDRWGEFLESGLDLAVVQPNLPSIQMARGWS